MKPIWVTSNAASLITAIPLNECKSPSRSLTKPDREVRTVRFRVSDRLLGSYQLFNNSELAHAA